MREADPRVHWLLVAASTLAGSGCQRSNRDEPPATSRAPRVEVPLPTPRVIVPAEEDVGVGPLAAIGDHLYWSEVPDGAGAGPRIVHATGAAREHIPAGGEALAVDATHLYYVHDAVVVRRPHAGGTPETVAAFAPTLAMAVADGAVYGIVRSATDGRHELWRGAIGQSPVKLAEGASLNAVAVHATRVYFDDHDGVHSIALDGTDRRTLITDTTLGFVVDDTGVYAGTEADGGVRRIVRVALDGGRPAEISRSRLVVAADASHVFAIDEDQTLVAIDKHTRATAAIWRPRGDLDFALDVERATGVVYVKNLDGVLEVPFR